MKKYLCGLAVLLLLTNCQKGSEGDSPVAPFTINLSQKMITCFPKDVKIFDFNVTGPEATNLKLEVVITEPWKYKLLKFEPSADGGYNGTIEITAPSKKSEASNYSTIDITVLSETYSSHRQSRTTYIYCNKSRNGFQGQRAERDHFLSQKRRECWSFCISTYAR